MHVASRLKPLAMRCLRQPSLPLLAARMRAVSPSCGGTAAAPHALSGGGEGRGSRSGGRRGRRARGRRGLGGGHVVCGPKVQPLRHEAREGGEVALLRRLEKSLPRLRAQPSALSAVAGARGGRDVWGGSSRAGGGPRSTCACACSVADISLPWHTPMLLWARTRSTSLDLARSTSLGRPHSTSRRSNLSLQRRRPVAGFVLFAVGA